MRQMAVRENRAATLKFLTLPGLTILEELFGTNKTRTNRVALL
jgi:hypothetical protein